MFGHSMFGEFEVQYFGVHSKTNKNAEKDKYVLYSLIPQNCYNNIKDSHLSLEYHNTSKKALIFCINYHICLSEYLVEMA